VGSNPTLSAKSPGGWIYDPAAFFIRRATLRKPNQHPFFTTPHHRFASFERDQVQAAVVLARAVEAESTVPGLLRGRKRFTPPCATTTTSGFHGYCLKIYTIRAKYGCFFTIPPFTPAKRRRVSKAV
jgi:hypothetical protein